jgi:hypothetical protein
MYQARIRKDLQEALPELAQLPQPRQEAIFAMLSFEYWDRLRDHQSNSADDSVAVLTDMLETLVTPA